LVGAADVSGYVPRNQGQGVASTLDKPAGISVFPPHAELDGDCVLKRLLVAEPERAELAWPAGFEGGIAHRLDISTSGALWVADSVDELAQMRACFASKQLVKTYRLRVAKSPVWDVNETDRAIAHDRRRKGRMVVQRGEHTPHRGRWYPARTDFRRVHGTLFEVTMHTGVMHQIRVHAAFLGIALLGDRRYGGGPTPQDAPDGVQFYLHHVGLVDASGWGTQPVPLPEWAR
jgi:23S rRNA-/tRNA-specific pseudouridylate synthase